MVDESRALSGGPEATVIVTGASRGIGREVARVLAAAGSRLALVARSAEALDEVSREVEHLGGTPHPIVADLTDSSIAGLVVDSTLQRFGQLDGLVNNAGTIEPVQRVADVDVPAWARLMAVNVVAPLALCRHAIPALRLTRGRIVNVASSLGVRGVPALSGYGCSKAALIQLTRVLAAEEPSICSTAYVPGPTSSDLMDLLRQQSSTAMPPEWSARYQQMESDNLLAPPEWPGRAIAWLATCATSELSGALVERDHEVATWAFQRFGGTQHDYRLVPPPETSRNA